MNNTKENLTFGEYLSNFLNDANVECFQRCVKDYLIDTLNPIEKKCVDSCFEKYFVSYSNMAELMELKK